MSGSSDASYAMAAILLSLTAVFHRGAHLDDELQPTRSNRTLFDLFVFGPVLLIISADIAERFGAGWGWFAVGASVNVGIQLVVFRKLRDTFLRRSEEPDGKRFQEMFSGIMRIITFLGPETHLLMLYLACWFAFAKPIALLACMVSFVTTFNFALGVAVSHGRKMKSFS